jgi:hypothetical protein
MKYETKRPAGYQTLSATFVRIYQLAMHLPNIFAQNEYNWQHDHKAPAMESLYDSKSL